MKADEVIRQFNLRVSGHVHDVPLVCHLLDAGFTEDQIAIVVELLEPPPTKELCSIMIDAANDFLTQSFKHKE